MPSKHAILGPSSAYRWLTCTPSARFEEQLAEEETEYAAEGTLAHDLAALVLSARAGLFQGSQVKYNAIMAEIEEQVIAFYESIDNYDGANEFLTMLEHAETWAAIIKEQGGDILIETEYDISQYVPVGFGTADATNLLPLILYVNDYKYGAGVRVYAEENEQLMLYGLGALTDAVNRGYRPETVVLNIFQPRAGGLSTWEISVTDLLHWAEFTVHPQALKAIAGEGEFVPGEHCQFCKARVNCKAYYDKFADILEIQDKRVMTPQDRATVLTYGAMLTSWVNKVQDDLINKMRGGTKIPGFKLVKGRTTRSFSNEDNVVDILLGEGYDSYEIFNPALKTLTDIEKMVGPKKFKTLFAQDIINKEGKPKIVSEDDGRADIGRSAADDYDDDLI